MKKGLLLFFLTTIFGFNCYSQISYEKGYFIDNSNQKTDCLIKNIDWKDNPINFKYKLTIDGSVKNANIKSIKEFGIYNSLKYIRKTVKIDRSSSNLNQLSINKNPLFVKEELFLKVLVEGKASLYYYEDGNLTRFFYNKEKSIIEQLVFKSYVKTDKKIEKNNQYKQQLWNSLKCATINLNKIENLKYEKIKLINLFIEYHKCNNSEFIFFENKQKKDILNLTLRPRFNSSSLTTDRISPNKIHFDFGNKVSFGFGLEAEYILPFNKNKWSVVIEPTYQSYKSEQTVDVNSVFGGKLIAEVSYSSIEVPIGFRHYFFLNKNSKIFTNISYSFDLISNSSIEIKRADNVKFTSLEIKKGGSLAYGIGFKLDDKYSLEMRYLPGTNILKHYSSWEADYKTVSIIFGYSIF